MERAAAASPIRFLLVSDVSRVDTGQAPRLAWDGRDSGVFDQGHTAHVETLPKQSPSFRAWARLRPSILPRPASEGRGVRGSGPGARGSGRCGDRSKAPRALRSVHPLARPCHPAPAFVAAGALPGPAMAIPQSAAGRSRRTLGEPCGAVAPGAHTTVLILSKLLAPRSALLLLCLALCHSAPRG